MTRRRWVPLDGVPTAVPQLDENGLTVAAVVTDEFPAYAAFDGFPQGPALVTFADVLARHTATPDECWFTIWEGYSMASSAIPGRAVVDVGGLPSCLFRGKVIDLPDLSGFLATPNLNDAMAAQLRSHGQEHLPMSFWPGDGTWLAGWNVDAANIVVGGTEALMADLLTESTLDVVRTTSDAELVWG